MGGGQFFKNEITILIGLTESVSRLRFQITHRLFPKYHLQKGGGGIVQIVRKIQKGGTIAQFSQQLIRY